jgi:tRNA1(Val) A37 N6-methylase TrmN6
MLTTEGTLLGGRIVYRQPESGFRSGIEPVLLAASIPATGAERVLEAGTGAGPALLCLHARLPGLRATGIEIDPAMAALAKLNLALNGAESMEIVGGAVETASVEGPFDHAFANPPYHAEDGQISPNPHRDTAKRAPDRLIAAWIGRLSALLRHRGTLTLIVPAARTALCLGAMTDAHCPATVLFPLWPKTGRPAKLVLLRGVRNARSPLRLSPGLVLHRADGGFTDAAKPILEGAGRLSLEF